MDRRRREAVVADVVAARDQPLLVSTKKKMTNGGSGIRGVVPKLCKSSVLLFWLAQATIRAEQSLARKGGSGSGSAFAFVATKRRQTRKRFPCLDSRQFSSGSMMIRNAEARISANNDDIDANSNANANTNASTDSMEEIPLVFLHGMKGSHLAFPTGSGEATKSQRSWLSLGGLLNFPPRDDGHHERDISLPLSYTDQERKSKSGGATFPIQDRSKHFVDGTVDHVVALSGMLPMPSNGGTLGSNTGNLDFFPFYGHATKFLEEVNEAYVQGSSTDGSNINSNINNGDDPDPDPASTSTSSQGRPIDSTSIMNPRPTRSFCYDWRRNLFELTEEFHAFCEHEFPNGQPVQVVAHSMGGLIAYAAMKEHPDKYKPGGVLVGVPFGTGIQYFQDLHKGYFTELGTCRQFLPPAQFTFSSHWSFFPIDRDELGDSFVDVSEFFDDDNDESSSGSGSGSSTIAFEADRSTIGKKTSADDPQEEKWRPATPGKPIEIEFYDPEEWERNEIGIFDPSYRHAIDANDHDRISEYKQHMRLQMKDALRWRTTAMAPWDDEEKARNHMPPLTICSSVSVPTPNQILRRKRLAAPKSASTSKLLKVSDYFPRSLISLLEKGDSQPPCCKWEYDYASGRTVPGDGRIDYDKSFPPLGTSYSTVDLDSVHAKQFCWEETGGNLSTVWAQVNQQLGDYHTSASGPNANEAAA